LIKKNRDIVNTKNFQNYVGYYFLFLFFCIFDIFFSILPIYDFQKIVKIFVLFCCVDPRFYQKICKTMVFCFKKNWDIWNR